MDMQSADRELEEINEIDRIGIMSYSYRMFCMFIRDCDMVYMNDVDVIRMANVDAIRMAIRHTRNIMLQIGARPST